jgi:hypothetical protein
MAGWVSAGWERLRGVSALPDSSILLYFLSLFIRKFGAWVGGGGEMAFSGEMLCRPLSSSSSRRAHTF